MERNGCSRKNAKLTGRVITITSKFFDTRVYPSLCSWISSLSSGWVLAILHKTGFKQRCPFCSVTMKILECKLRVLSRNPYLFLKSLLLTVHGVFCCSSTFWWRPIAGLSRIVLQIVLLITTWIFSFERTVYFNLGRQWWDNALFSSEID